MSLPAVVYKEFYNMGRGLPEPKWGSRALRELQCPTCGSQDMYFSGSPDDPEEIFGAGGDVRCGHCGRITDWYEAHKQRQNHPTETPREVVREDVGRATREEEERRGRPFILDETEEVA